MTARPRTAAEPSVDAIADALVTASRLLLDITARAVAVVDDTLTVPQLRVLALLSSHGPTNLTTLAAQLDVQPSTVGRMADRLVTAGLIDRHRHPSSGREMVVELTRRGRAVVDTVSARRRAEIARVVEVMPPRERLGMVRALHAFSEAGGEPPADAPAGLDF
ncbi:MarR family winged helix-turn-helix transcriptional regulator [Mycolicibacterium phocaicum]|uniref:MarR family transcriptional regulator n=1 Tax=Mycolicibacterium phocaicum TaxID=319706 RepID=A0A7I7ZMI8_9MYCO|nr:MarR family transcriptional regulator [Mycolicibacterium phocaicum]TLH71455.1 MarR family transcriptional regulator [Mycolicibacterium phocaicum]BBZ54992.1 MarR family transcriptional regulator [Mycolicibacterium phocaicum]